jgi:hypothetical protein
MTKLDTKTIALRYIDACARKDYETLAPLLAPDLRYVGPANKIDGAGPYLATLRRIGAIWLRSDVKKVFTDGDEACVIYDLVTDTPAGAVRIVEWLRVDDAGRIASVTLLFDRVAFQPAGEELARRAVA